MFCDEVHNNSLADWLAIYYSGVHFEKFSKKAALCLMLAPIAFALFLALNS